MTSSPECDTDKRGRLPPSESPLASSLEGDTNTVGQLQRDKSSRVVVSQMMPRSGNRNNRKSREISRGENFVFTSRGSRRG